ncbi:MAG TPA: hypothetical protein PKK11_03840 [Methanothrix sp.]|nr:hypothetical protein [Methanothrix sp.]HPT20240.1 hypothetical protein [Methanothrix sp.]
MTPMSASLQDDEFILRGPMVFLMGKDASIVVPVGGIDTFEMLYVISQMAAMKYGRRIQ